MPLTKYRRPSRLLPPPTPVETMHWMVRFAQEGQFDPELRGLAEQIVRGVFPHDYLSEYAAILGWIRVNIRYVRDPRTLEQVKIPRVTVETGTGDCDDLSTLTATLVGSVGGQVRFVAGAFKRGGNGQPVLSHVWAEAWDPVSKAWVILDPVPGRNVGQMVQKLIHTMDVLAIA